jgi:Protein of unknown function (DUF4199)
MKQLTARNKGLLTAAVMILLQLFFFYILKQPVKSDWQYIIYSLFTIGIIWTLWDYKKRTADTPRFKELFAEGFKMFAIVALLMVAYVFVFYKFNTGIIDAQFAENDRLLLQQGDHTPAEIAANTQQMKRIFMPMMLGITTFMYLFLGSLITVVAAVFLSQKKQTDINKTY